MRMTRLLLLFWLVASPALAADTPNIVLVMTDDQGWYELGCHGNRHIQTPTMDRLAAEGVELTRFYATPVCAPTRAGLMTGRHYHRTGTIDTYMGRDVLRSDEILLPELLRRAGYRTGIVGKWHLGRYMKYHPLNRGFDYFFGFWQYGFINGYQDPHELFMGTQPVTTAGYITDVLTDQAIRFVYENRDRPFFLYVPYNAPHSPHLVPDRYIQPYLAKGVPLRDARIYGMITAVDENLARLLGAIDAVGARDNTLVIFMTDNGGTSAFEKVGLRGHKMTVYEGGIRVPFFARWPGRFPAGAKVDALTSHLDVMPTLCELVGQPLPNDRPIDGRSVLTLLREGRGESPHRFLCHQWNRVRPNPNDSWAIHAGQYKLVNGELFDLQADPGERKNLAAEMPDKAREMRGQFLAWFEEVTAGQDYATPPIEVGRPDENPVEIDIAWAELHGKVQYRYRSYHRDSIEDWTAGAAATWAVDVTQAGRYEVMLSYGCDPETAGGRYVLSCGDSRREGRTESSGGRLLLAPRVIGEIDLPAGRAELRLEAIELRGKDLMTLHKVHLRRVS